MLKNSTFFVGIALFALLGVSIHADMFDPLRPEEEREARDGEKRSVGLGFQEVETRGGEKRVEFKPLESLFGGNRSNNHNSKPVTTRNSQYKNYAN